MSTTHKQTTWFLEGFTDETRRMWRTPLNALPFRIGRSSECQLFLDSPSVSQSHAEITVRGGELRITDLESTNGTFVNDERIEAARVIGDGDDVRFADWEFRVVKHGEPVGAATATEELRSLSRSPGGELEVAGMFREMMHSRSLWAVFQPIVRLADRSVVGYEALGRARMDGAEVLPGELFGIAEGLGRAAELSHLLRRAQLRDAADLPEDPEIFLNTHPSELRTAETLVDSLATSGHDARRRLCIEINETAAMDLALLAGLREKLAGMGVNVAFDDFGTGQPRLFELAEISPVYVKFDRAWIEKLDSASERRLELVKMLVRMVRGFKITPIAEGVERPEEARACAEVGFELAQGFYLGRPDRASAFG